MGQAFDGSKVAEAIKEAAGPLEEMEAGIKNVNQAGNVLWLSLALACVDSGRVSKEQIVTAINQALSAFEVTGDPRKMVEQVRDTFASRIVEEKAA